MLLLRWQRGASQSSVESGTPHEIGSIYIQKELKLRTEGFLTPDLFHSISLKLGVK